MWILNVWCLVTQSCPTLVTSWTVACQAPLSMGFSRQEYWCGLPFPPPGDHLPNTGIEPASFTSPALAGRFFTTQPLGNTNGLKISFLIKNCQPSSPPIYTHSLLLGTLYIWKAAIRQKGLNATEHYLTGPSHMMNGVGTGNQLCRWGNWGSESCVLHLR